MSFLGWVQSGAAGHDRNEVAELVADFLGEGALDRSVVSRSLAGFEQVNLQTALDAWSREEGRTVDVPQLGRVILEDDVEVGANSSSTVTSARRVRCFATA